MDSGAPVDGDTAAGEPSTSTEPQFGFLAELARIVLGREPLDRVLTKVAEAACRSLEPAQEVSLTLVERDRPYTVACTGQLALDADELQYAEGHGPCIEAGEAGVRLLVSDFATESRWPGYAAQALGCGLASSLSVPLPIQDVFIGAVNLYSRLPRAFDDPGVGVLAEQLAGYAAVAVSNANAFGNAARAAENMTRAMASRSTIDQAIGIVMGRRRCTAEAAFRTLVVSSQQANRKLRDIAREVVDAAPEDGPTGGRPRR